MHIKTVISCEFCWTFWAKKLATNSFNLMNCCCSIHKTNLLLIDIAEVIFAFHFGVKYLITCSIIIYRCHFYFGWLIRVSYCSVVVMMVSRSGIKPSKPSRPSARARLGGLHARFGLLGGPFWPLGLGSVRPSSRLGCLGSVWLQPWWPLISQW